jgi:hypothetical protein
MCDVVSATAIQMNGNRGVLSGVRQHPGGVELHEHLVRPERVALGDKVKALAKPLPMSSTSSRAANAWLYNELWRLYLQTNPGRDAAISFGRTLAKAFGLRVRF